MQDIQKNSTHNQSECELLAFKKAWPIFDQAQEAFDKYEQTSSFVYRELKTVGPIVEYFSYWSRTPSNMPAVPM